LLFSLICYGWGRLAFRLAYGRRAPLHAYVMGLGIVSLIFIGGLLNLVKQATELGLSICAIFGIGLAVYFLFGPIREATRRLIVLRTRISISGLLLSFFLIGVTAFLLIELVPTQLFHYSDDFFLYMVRPVRMLAIGTVGGNPFEVLGMSDFGAQSFLQAIFMLWLPLTSITEFDTVFCFLLGIILIVEIGRTSNAQVPVIALAIASFVVISPQIINLSSVYSTSVVLLTLLSASNILLCELDKRKSFWLLMRHAAPVGASLAALLALKLTAAFFVGSFLIVFFVLAPIVDLPCVLRLAIVTVVTAGVALAPWLVVHADKFDVTHWSSPRSEILESTLTMYPTILDAFRGGPSYDGRRIGFVMGVVVMSISLVAGAFMLLRRPTQREGLLRVTTDSAGVLTYISLAALRNNLDALRYACPFLIALVSSRLLFPLNGDVRLRKSYLTLSLPKALGATIIAAQVGVLLIFAPNLFNRVYHIATHHTAMSVIPSRDPQLAALSDRRRDYIRSIQALTPAGSTIWAWINTSFHFDFKRNRIWNFRQNSFEAPWRMNASTSDSLRQDLEGRGVDYILWQYRSDWIPSLSDLRRQRQEHYWVDTRIIVESTFALVLALQDLASSSDIIYDDGRCMLLDLRSAGAKSATHVGKNQ
jgi:hypothetical protein